MRLRISYFALALLIFIIEIAIARGLIGGSFVRGSIGDVLVITLLYFLLRAASKLASAWAALLAVSVGFVVEALQYIHIADRLGLAPSSVWYIVIGNTYSTSDLLMYVIGGVLAWAVDRYVFIPHLMRS